MAFPEYSDETPLRNLIGSVQSGIDQEVERVDNDSEIINDHNGLTKESTVVDGNSGSTARYQLEQDSRNLNFLNRRRSVDDTLSPAPKFHRRSSLQAPNKIHEYLPLQHCRSSSEMFIRNTGSCQIPVNGIGSELFFAFLQEEIHRSNLKIPESLQNTLPRESIHCASSDVHEFLNLGTHLRLMADEFASSDHRQRVRERADRVPLSSLDAESFTDLLFGMFQQGGVTCERVLVLFVFCADLAMRALREHLIACFNNVMNWSRLYIESWLTPWVQRHGGWAVVLERSVHEAYRAVVLGACMMGVLALWTYIRSAGH